MSLRARTLLTIGLTTISLVVVLSLIFSRTLLQAFAEAELRDMERDVGHARAFLADELRTIDILNHDWASWDDTYAFIEDADPAYIRSNVTDETFLNTHLNLMLFVHASGRVVLARAYDLEAQRETPVPQEVYDALPVLTRATEEGQRGLLLLPEGVLLVTARPILTSEDQGPARGVLIFGRYLNSGLLDRASTHLGLSVTAYRADRPEEWPEDLRAVYPQLSPEAPIRARALDGARIAGYGLMADLYGRPALILRTEGPREISARGLLALRYWISTVAALALLVALAVLLFLDRDVLVRLASLTAQVRAVGAAGEPRGRVAMPGRDELADLARAFNETLDALERAHQERGEREAQLLRLAENSPDVIYRFRLSPFRPEYISPAVTRLLGYPPEAFYEDWRLLYHIVHPEDLPLLQSALRLEVPPEEPLPLRWVNRDGETVWAEHRHIVVYDRAGQAVAVEGIARDITERKRAEEELARLNAVLQAIRHINQAITREKDRERLIQAACEELVRTRGYAGAWAILFGPDGRPETGTAVGVSAEDFARVLAAWKEEEEPTPCARQVLVMSEPLIIPEPEACLGCSLRLAYPGAAAIAIRLAYGERTHGVLCVALPPGIMPSPEEQRLLTEVTGDLAFALHSLEQEAALRESEERFRLLAENSLTGIYLIQDGLLRYVNPAAARMFGYEPEELIGQMSPLDVVAPEDRERVTENMRRRLAGEVMSVRYTIQGLRRDGSCFPCEVLGTRVEYRGRPAILGSIVDLTDRARAEEAVRRRAEQTEALRQIALELFAQPDPGVLLPSIVRRAVGLVGGSAGGLYLYRPEEDILEWVVSVGPDQPPVGTRLQRDEGLAGLILETGRPFWVDDYQNWEGRAAIYAGYPWTAVIGVPVQRGEEMLGVLIVCADPPHTFSQEDADLLDLFAAQAAVALTNARLYEAIRREREQLDFLHRLGQHLAGTLDVAAVAQEALETLCGITGAQQGVVFALEPGTPHLRLVAVVGHEGATVDELDRRIRLEIGEGLSGWVAHHRRTAVVDDVLRDDRWLVARGMDEHIRSAVSVPLLFREELVGVMTLGSPATAAFTPDHARLLEAAGAVIASALLNARLYQAEQERARRMAAVAEVSQRLAASLDPETVYQELVGGVVRAFGYDYAGLMLLDEKAGELEFVAGAGIWAGRTPPGFRQKVGEGMIGWVARHGETLLANDVSQEPRYIAPYLTETRAELDVPLKYHEQMIGVLTIQSARRYAFTPLDVATLETLAADAAAAIENARLYEQERRARERMEALYRIGQIVNSTLDPEVILDRLTAEAIRATGATHGSVLVPDPERGVFERRSLRGYSPEERERALARPLSLTEGINSRAYRTRLVYYVPDVRQDPDYFPLIPITRSELVIPLLRGDRVLGNLDLQSPQVDAFRNVDMEFLRALADQVAIALENARLYEEERRRAQEQEVLTLIATALNTLEVQRAFPILVHGLRTLTDCDRVAVALLAEDGTHSRISVLETPRPVLGVGTVLPLSTTPVWEDVLEGRPHFCADMSQEVEYATIRALYEAGFRSYVSLPLRAGGRVIGALHVVSLRERHFRSAQVPLLQQVADALAAALENERLYQAEREQRELAQALAEAAAAVTRTLDPAQMLEQVLEQVARVVPGDAFNVMLVEDGVARILRWRGYEQFGAEEQIASVALPVAEVLNLREMVSTGQPVLIPDTHADPNWAHLGGLDWIRSYVAAPIVIRGITVGFLNVDGTRPHQFGPADAARLKAFADQVAIALENAHLYEDARQRAERMEALYETSRAVSSLREESDVIRVILEEIGRLLQCEFAIISLADEERGEIGVYHGIWHGQFGLYPEWVTMSRYPLDHPDIIADVYRTGRTEVIVGWDERFNREVWEKYGHERYLRVFMPIRFRERTFGVIEVSYDRSRKERVTEEELRLLSALVDQVAVALENARLYQELRLYASTLEGQVRERTAQLAAQYARLEAILRSTGDGIILADTRGEILQANPVAQGWLTRDLAPEDARRLEETVRRVARRARERPEEVVELPGLDLEIRASPIEGPEGEAAAVVILHDVTQFKTLERLRARFISNISHELRTPLTTIKTYLHLLRGMPELLPEYLDILEREADWQARLVEDVLEISRLDSGTTQMQFNPVRLNTLATEVVDAQRPLALAQGLVLECCLAEGGPVARADPDALRMVLNNLVRNAIQYTPAGGRVEVSTGEEEQEGYHWATIVVADTGIGIPRDELPYIFDRFFRGERPRQMQIPGTGLGLSIVKEIVDRHGGRITVESEEGKGTRFTVWLPVAEERPPSEGQ